MQSCYTRGNNACIEIWRILDHYCIDLAFWWLASVALERTFRLCSDVDYQPWNETMVLRISVKCVGFFTLASRLCSIANHVSRYAYIVNEIGVGMPSISGAIDFKQEVLAI